MRRKGSVTVVFSLVFLVLLSFFLSFFEMAAYTARASYHASAALLAVENYFAGYLEPLYAGYHIFGREVTAGEGLVTTAEKLIREDITCMTAKEEGQRSLLLRSGAAFSVTTANTLTANKGEGFYSQAVTAMKYRGIVEIKELLQQFTKTAEQTDAHLEIAAAKAATDEAYAVVEGKLLTLIEQVDGVILSEYEQYLRGASTVFQAETYVKQLCTDREGAEKYFDRAEVYQAFLKTSQNPEEVLENVISKGEYLLPLIQEREQSESACRSRLAELEEKLEQVSEKYSGLLEQQTESLLEVGKIQKQMDMLSETSEEDMKLYARLTQKLETIAKETEERNAEKEKLLEQEAELLEAKTAEEECLSTLEKKRILQNRELWGLAAMEMSLVEKCERVAEKCVEAGQTLAEIQTAMERAKWVRADCETIIDTAAKLLGEDGVKSYREALKMYQRYESAEGYDFEQMQQTLTVNEEILKSVQKCYKGTGSKELEETLEKWGEEKEALGAYSFEGLTLNYGELSLEASPYDGMEEALLTKVSEGFLSFLTEKELSQKTLDTAYLPSGFQYEGAEEKSVFSVLKLGVSDVFEEIRNILPEDLSPASVAGQVTDRFLFHSYLVTHFSSFLEQSEAGALSYELEYLIGGKESDVNNLSGAVMRICMLRMALQFVSIYGDSARRMQAEQAAMAACGVIGLPALASVLTFALLLVWAVEEAMIDTAALLQGKKLLLYPGTGGGSLYFPELLLFSGTMVQERAKAKKDVPGALFGYGEYLQLFLFLEGKEKTCCRAMDLVQENLRLSYNSAFRLKRCVWEISYRVDGRKYSYAYDW